MPRRPQDLTPWPLATPEQAAEYFIERTSTAAGARLSEAGVAIDEVVRRVEVRIEQIRIDAAGEATGLVHTRVDGGEWINEGGYVLSRKLLGYGASAAGPLDSPPTAQHEP